MRISIVGNVRPVSDPPRSSRPKLALLGIILLLTVDLFMLWARFGFAEYAAGGFLWWSQTPGTVINADHSSNPTVQFAADDGTPHQFREDYILLCQGSRTLCFVRNFAPGEVVQVVYDPYAPQRAYIHDWALFATAGSWFLEALAALVLLLMLAASLSDTGSFSFQIGQRVEAD